MIRLANCFTCGELETAARYRLPITFIVISNASYGWIKAGQKSRYDQRYFSVDFATTDHAAVAAAFGAGFVAAGGIGATMRLLMGRGREGRTKARFGPFSFVDRD